MNQGAEPAFLEVAQLVGGEVLGLLEFPEVIQLGRFAPAPQSQRKEDVSNQAPVQRHDPEVPPP